MTSSIPEHAVRSLPRPDRLYVREVQGPYTRRRWICIWLTQLVYFGLPWLDWNGRQAVLFDLGTLKFYLFGLVLWPQDLVYVAALWMSAVLLLLLLTTFTGRVWCALACPHSVYGELFLWIERRTEGSRGTRIRRDAEPPGLSWAARKLAKHLSWLALSAAIGWTLLAYFTPIEGLLRQMADGRLGTMQIVVGMAYGGLAYLNAGWLRATFCKQICAWARLQTAVIGPHTCTISYDAVRGEPRGIRGRRIDPQRRVQLGDCVDCTLCLQVCPTGTDIRLGFDLACIDCGACIDACDAVMAKTGKRAGLIRHSAAMAEEKRCPPDAAGSIR